MCDTRTLNFTRRAVFVTPDGASLTTGWKFITSLAEVDAMTTWQIYLRCVDCAMRNTIEGKQSVRECFSQQSSNQTQNILTWP